MNIKLLEVFGLQVHCFQDIKKAVSHIMDMDIRDKGVILTALNPEKVLKGQESKEIGSILKKSDVLYADGMGIVKAVKLKYGESIKRVPGCELWEALVAEAGKTGMPVFFVGASKEVNQATAEKAARLYGVNIVGHEDGFFEHEDALIEQIKASKAEFVSVALGSPRQEQFMFKCKDNGVKAVMMGVGGTYDVFTGHVKRAPRIFCKFGLEWLYRLLAQPSRIGRQIKLLRFVAMLFRQK
ncbi:lipopolysaccharide N-acetylmannosaminouronosyltransferase [Pseudoalteromonas rubra]|uniref:Lipopolysaccharide N-acetylmannosaminouronosyltransferase n=1 Tax=Pseudoalteromonas rubra TaxID=43658 RepID=A0A5S3WTD9_9GAMM|nr:WecB/TagA/CpsF family glycosyltransferase [Pseudoalteromonas rubra]TMP31461.1 lipopolysaccharide N-acetylmannosaminouronosyltransferase [Pseudoalteromonas rubra]TMP34545.1 lipopolysaccharide N-acetylmannosaminouronosyltransferase [Pseudoalteromonas rubra]